MHPFSYKCTRTSWRGLLRKVLQFWINIPIPLWLWKFQIDTVWFAYNNLYVRPTIRILTSSIHIIEVWAQCKFPVTITFLSAFQSNDLHKFYQTSTSIGLRSPTYLKRNFSNNLISTTAIVCKRFAYLDSRSVKSAFTVLIKFYSVIRMSVKWRH
jgi:hypothetical protein